MEVRDRHLTPGFDLVVKHNALFTALLPDLLSAFPVYGIVRNPLAVLASWNAVNLPVKQGGHSCGREVRHCTQVAAGSNVRPRCSSALDPGMVLSAVRGDADSGVHSLLRGLRGQRRRRARNTGDPALLRVTRGRRESRNATYDLELVRMLHQRLEGFGDAVWRFYSREDVAALYESSQR